MQSINRAAFICTTKYHIFNCINFIKHQNEYENMLYDIYLRDTFDDINSLIVNLDRINTIRKVFVFSDIARVSGNKKTFYEIMRFVDPTKFVKSSLKDDYEELSYDFIFCATATKFNQAMILSNNFAKIFYYDDGAGSYIGSKVSSLSMKAKILYFLLNKKYKRIIYPNRLYINNLNVCKSTVARDIRQLPKVDFSNIELRHEIYKVLGNVDLDYTKLQIVYLAQPFSAPYAVTTQKTDDILNLIKKYKYIYRPHPREKQIYCNPSLVDNGENLWELICADQISDNHILIGRCSTAQLAPKWFFNKEPYLIFTYKFFAEETSKAHISVFDKLCTEIKCLYSDPNKIFVVESIEQLDEVLSGIVQLDV